MSKTAIEGFLEKKGAIEVIDNVFRIINVHYDMAAKDLSLVLHDHFDVVFFENLTQTSELSANTAHGAIIVADFREVATTSEVWGAVRKLIQNWATKHIVVLISRAEEDDIFFTGLQQSSKLKSRFNGASK